MRINARRVTKIREKTGKREPRRPPIPSQDAPVYAVSSDGSASGTAATVAVLPTNTADVSHMTAISAHGQSTLARNLALLFGAHGRETAPTLFPAALGFGACAPASRSRPRSPARLRCAPARGAFLGTAGARLAGRFILCGHGGPASVRLGATAGGALPIRLFGLDSRRAAVIAGFTDREWALIAAARI